MMYSEEQYNALLAVCRSYRNDYDKVFERLKAQQREIDSLKAENANLTVENEALKSEKENLMRTVEEGGEELIEIRKETAKEIVNRLIEIFSTAKGTCSSCALQHNKAKNPAARAFQLGKYKGFKVAEYEVKELAKQYGVEVEE